MTVQRPFLDTNIIIRHLTRDNPDQSPRCFAVVQALENGSMTAWTSHMVIAEAVFVLTRIYGLDRPDIARALLPIIDLHGLKIVQKRLFRRVFELFTTTSLSFMDCYHAALVEQNPDRHILSYDRGFDRVSGIIRIEP